MKLTIAIVALVAVAAVAGPIIEDNPQGIDAGRAVATQQGIRALPDWQALKDDRAAYVTDKATYTGLVAQISDAPTKQAVKALAACVQDQQQMIADLKRCLLAVANSTTNNAVIGQ